MTPPDRPGQPPGPPSGRRPAPAPGPVAFLDGMLWLLGFWLGGELVVRTTGLPVPGAVVGMLGLFVTLQVRRPRPDAHLLRASDGLLAHLQLLFVPAGVGIVSVLGVLRSDALPLVGGLLVSWVVALVVLGWVVALLLPRDRGGPAVPAGGGDR
ncbi:CidA/LrgA family protein [Nocardioides zeae]|uniref:CidA/LrgA family protein n=1 Tax=Nocardioides imazamoxiresistens TaxID=3231893 RepID=A0ABU3PT94_9ACTN|nr:CidA/LrgA family protein [Nocardioides zeae]MDT9592062.1 CidA/LrgA family protein [Nocardioides zeae]